MKGQTAAKAIYYVLVFCWLLQVAMQGYTRDIILPTAVLIVYGLWLRHYMKRGNKNNKNTY